MLLRLLATAALVVTLGLAHSVAAQEKHEAKARDFAESSLKKWMAEPVVLKALAEQNGKHAALTQADIDKLDKQWRAETKAPAKPLITVVLASPLSAYLKQLKADSKGMITEIFVMDAKGLNVGQSDVTSDYWQGDEAKWQKSFSAGPGAIFVDKVEKDESTQTFQTQISISIVDPSSNKVVGAVTVGVDVEQLMN
jgi:hypothetical protein